MPQAKMAIALVYLMGYATLIVLLFTTLTVQKVKTVWMEFAIVH